MIFFRVSFVSRNARTPNVHAVPALWWSARKRGRSSDFREEDTGGHSERGRQACGHYLLQQSVCFDEDDGIKWRGRESTREKNGARVWYRRSGSGWCLQYEEEEGSNYPNRDFGSHIQ